MWGGAGWFKGLGFRVRKVYDLRAQLGLSKGLVRADLGLSVVCVYVYIMRCACVCVCRVCVCVSSYNDVVTVFLIKRVSFNGLFCHCCNSCVGFIWGGYN